MPNFGRSLTPAIDAYQRAQSFGQQQEMGQLQQFQAVQGILAQQKAQQEEQQLRGVLSQTDGDPAKAVQMLVKTGTPASLSLAAKLHSLMPKPGPVSIGAGGLLMPDNTVVPPAARPEQQKETWGEPYQMGGAWVQKSSNGQIRTAVTREPQLRVTNEPPVTTIVVKDPASSTGWSYKDARTGRVTSQDAPAPAGDPARSYGSAAGSASAKDDLAQHDTAIAAAQDLPKIKNLVKTIQTSQAVTGMGAELLKNVERAKVLLANDKKAGKIVSDTEYLDSLMGSEVFSMIKPLGIGARGLDTPAEREFLRNVMTGQISLNKDTLLRMAKLREQVTERAVNKWNSRVKSGELNRYFESTGRSNSEIKVNAEDAQQPEAIPTPQTPAQGQFKIRQI